MKKKAAAPAQFAPNKNEVISLYRQALLSGIPLAVVHQKVMTAHQKAVLSAQAEWEEQQQLLKTYQNQIPLVSRLAVKVVPAASILLGIFLFGSAAVPIASYVFFPTKNFSESQLISPVPETQVLEGMQVVPQVQASDKKGEAVQAVADKTVVESSTPSQDDAPSIAPTIDNVELDYTNLSNWFPGLQLPSNSDTQQMSEYRLDIPAVNISNAEVKVGGSNLDKSLIQYPGTSDPGQAGTPVIFGHSVLRQFYNPSEKNPRRYFSIFSKIMTLKKGDEIFITQDNVRYTYQVEGRTVVQPEDTFILDQDYSQKTLKIVTCVPEGTYLQRGVITARLVKTE